MTAMSFPMPSAEPLLIVTVLEAGDKSLPMICTATDAGGLSFLKPRASRRRSFSEEQFVRDLVLEPQPVELLLEAHGSPAPRGPGTRTLCRGDTTVLNGPVMIRSKNPDTARTGRSSTVNRPCLDLDGDQPEEEEEKDQNDDSIFCSF